MSFVISNTTTSAQFLTTGETGVILPGGALVGANASAMLDARSDGVMQITILGALLNTNTNTVFANTGLFARAISDPSEDDDGDLTLVVGDGGVIGSAEGWAVFSGMGNTEIRNAGEIYGERGVEATKTLVLENHGLISGELSAIGIDDAYGANIVNTGRIVSSAGVFDISFDEVTGGVLRLQNLGEIISLGTGTEFNATWAVDGLSGGLILDNSGSIQGNISTDDETDDEITNSGEITGNVVMGLGVDNLSNTGTIIGDVNMDFGPRIMLSDTGSDAVVNNGTISGLVTNAGGYMAVQNTGTITGGVQSDLADVFNAGILGRNPFGTAFDRTVDINGSLTNTGQVLGSVALGEQSYLNNSGTITDQVSFTGSAIEMFNSGQVGSLLFNAYSSVLIRNSGEVQNFANIAGGATEFTNTGLMRNMEIFGDGTSAVLNEGIFSEFLVVDGLTSTVINTGEIGTFLVVGGSSASASASIGFESVVRNFGLIGDDLAMLDAGGVVINGGHIAGDVELSDGAATFRMVGDGTVGGRILGLDGNDTIVGGRFDDVINGGRQVDDLRGGAGDDSIKGDSGNDLLMGQAGDDDMNGGGGGDQMMGGHGDDYMFGSAGRDTMLGNAGADELDGGKSDDTLNGGRGSDILTGGHGADTFVFGLSASTDIITDFEDGVDRIDLRAYGLSASDLAVVGVLSDVSGSAVVDLNLLGGRGEIVLAGMASDLDSSDFIL